MTAFGTTTIDHLATVLGCHPGAEPMCPLALDHAGLKSTFHRVAPGIPFHAEAGWQIFNLTGPEFQGGGILGKDG